jgi:hypothetical protein
MGSERLPDQDTGVVFGFDVSTKSLIEGGYIVNVTVLVERTGGAANPIQVVSQFIRSENRFLQETGSRSLN